MNIDDPLAKAQVGFISMLLRQINIYGLLNGIQETFADWVNQNSQSALSEIGLG